MWVYAEHWRKNQSSGQVAYLLAKDRLSGSTVPERLDRFLDICNPLRYTLFMINMVCGKLLASAWVAGFFISVIETTLIFRGSFCGSNLVKHFFCHMRAVVRLSCLDSDLTEFIVTVISVSGLMGTFLLIILTYVFVLSTVLKIPSAEGKQKAFSTCASHLTVVIIHFGFASIVYLKPEASGGDDTLTAVPYTVITPFLSPLIFSLRNKDVKNAFRKVLGKTNSLNNLGLSLHDWLYSEVSEAFTLWHLYHLPLYRGWHMGIKWLSLGPKPWQAFT